MGQATNALLVYGFHLGGPEDWDGITDPPEWLDEACENDTLKETIAGRILAGFLTAAGHEATTELERLFGLTIEWHCSGDYPMYFLAAHAVTAHRGYPEPVSPGQLHAAILYRRDDAGTSALVRLKRAAETLGLTFNHEPQWWLASWVI